MAPEWVFNLPITSKVDVYSYGIVVLEIITGRSPTMMGNQGGEDGRRVTWVEKKREKREKKRQPWSSLVKAQATCRCKYVNLPTT